VNGWSVGVKVEETGPPSKLVCAERSRSNLGLFQRRCTKLLTRSPLTPFLYYPLRVAPFLVSFLSHVADNALVRIPVSHAL